MRTRRFTDPIQHRLHHCWLRARCQSNYRGEEWTITLEEYFNMWSGHEHRKGRASDSLVMTRIDNTQPWSRSNVELITRIEQMGRKNRRQAADRIGQPPRKYRKRTDQNV